MMTATGSITGPLGLALFRAFQAAASLATAHLLGVGYIMYMDLSGRWRPYALCKTRPAKTMTDYLPGLYSLFFDLATLFVPCLAMCLWYQDEKISYATTELTVDDLLRAATKFVAGYVLGKLWAFVIHYILHYPKLYRYHKKHHQKPADLVASAAWDDSAVEYAIMELPSFCLTLFAFPTYWWVHLAHFALHGLDGACGHSGFKAPGIMGYIFDGEYHYYHHAHLTINYAELEILDKMFGTHHSQDLRFVQKRV
eukprot:scaffold5017_cov171-Amphora_coffeaeformis.AAC.4